MKKFIFNIRQNFGGEIDDQNVWVAAESRSEAVAKVKSEYHSVVDITLLRTAPYEE